MYQEQKGMKLKSFKLHKKLGAGSYASVTLATDKNENEFAIKIYEKYKLVEGHRRKNLRREINIMNKLNH